MKFKEIEENIKNNSESIFSIHYSCEKLNDMNEGISPRITSITIMHLNSQTIHSFAIHLEAEIQKNSIQNITEYYDKLEKSMLEKLFAFIGNHTDAIYLHWNMQSIVFGFEALEHRFRVLTQQEPFSIPDSHRINLNDFFKLKYGENYVTHPRMQNLMKLNEGCPQGFLTGKEEATAFEQKQYINLYKSSSEKCRWLTWVYNKSAKGKIKTQNSTLLQRVIYTGEMAIFKILGLLAILFSAYQALLYIVGLFLKK